MRGFMFMSGPSNRRTFPTTPATYPSIIVFHVFTAIMLLLMLMLLVWDNKGLKNFYKNDITFFVIVVGLLIITLGSLSAFVYAYLTEEPL